MPLNRSLTVKENWDNELEIEPGKVQSNTPERQ
jgi:hypothetical protein